MVRIGAILYRKDTNNGSVARALSRFMIEVRNRDITRGVLRRPVVPTLKFVHRTPDADDALISPYMKGKTEQEKWQNETLLTTNQGWIDASSLCPCLSPQEFSFFTSTGDTRTDCNG